MELKTCPSCGNKHIWIEDIEAREAVEFYAVCTSCGMKGGNRKTPEEAAEAWNTRAERTCSLGEEVNALTMLLSGYSECAWRWCPKCNGATPEFSNYCQNCGAKVVGDE